MEKCSKFYRSIIHLQPVSRDLGVKLTAPRVDAPTQTEGLMKPMPAKPRDLIEHMPAAVIVQKNFCRRISGKYRLLEFLRKKFRGLDSNRLVFLPRADIDEPKVLQSSMGIDRLDQHRKIMPVTVEQMIEHLPWVQLRSRAKLRQRFLVGKRTTLATAEMITGKKSPLGPGQGLHEIAHRRIYIQFIRSHTDTITAATPWATHRFSIVHPAVPMKDCGA